MIWTKSKHALEQLLAESVRKRVQYHMTRYGNGVSYYMTRAWVTWDGKEIANLSTIKAEMESYELYQRADRQRNDRKTSRSALAGRLRASGQRLSGRAERDLAGFSRSGCEGAHPVRSAVGVG